MSPLLQFLDFDFSEDTDGHGVFDAMASVGSPHWLALQAETAQVLNWALDSFPNGPGPLEDGNEWQFELSASREWSADEGLRYDTARRQFSSQASDTQGVRHTLALTLSGGPAFCEALREAFPPSED
ncbi:hypothetical protein KGA65_03525 [Ideonella sp. B7]|uniref:hypothetical protein n=1 Tax=Ideonella benzenivorans TaxID=2831643 RepID=UPI001CECA3FA|nr:hypothetical protein [Ideonella benzenivorans]MCA6215608.1 hypothetical protein [Ideonella benzenivorans]